MAEARHGVLSKDKYAKIALMVKPNLKLLERKFVPSAWCKSGKSAEIYYAKSNDMSKGLAQRWMLEL